MQPKFYILLPIILTALAACTTVSEQKPIVAVPPETKPQTFWNAAGIEGEPSIAVSISRQRAYFFKGGKLVGESPISSGRTGFDTPPGSYKVTQRDEKHVSNLYGDYVDEEGNVVQSNVDVTKSASPDGAAFQGAKMPYFLRFTGGYGLHAGNLPGHRASHGCIRLPRSMAQHFFENAVIGMAVVVEP
jgi:lipoprotein-anchoring transpeptidase ErfK/SrfK